MLRQNPRLWYAPGEGRGQDPRAQTEDLGDNSVKASEYGLKNLKRVMDNLPQWTKEENDQYDDLFMIYNALLDQFDRYRNHVIRNIAGRYENNMPGQEPFDVIPKARQKEALDYLGRNIFDAPAWLFPATIINKVNVNPSKAHNAMQENVLGRVLSGYVLNTLYNQQSMSSETYPVEEYLSDLHAQVWKSLDDANAWKNQQRRSLQRMYIAQLDKILNPDAKALSTDRVDQSDVLLFVLQHMKQLEQELKGKAGDGNINALHYQDLLERLQLIQEKRKSPNR